MAEKAPLPLTGRYHCHGSRIVTSSHHQWVAVAAFGSQLYTSELREVCPLHYDSCLKAPLGDSAFTRVLIFQSNVAPVDWGAAIDSPVLVLRQSGWNHEGRP